MANTTQPTETFPLEIFSFGFKYGLPADVNLLFDVRFLPNPYWEEEMRHLTGRDSRVAAYVLESESGRGFLPPLHELLTYLISRNIQAGKDRLHIGIGCTGGHHRSVAVVEALGRLLACPECTITISHRDIHRE